MEQNKKKICWIRVLKNVSYVLAPILIVMLVLSISCVFFTYNMGIEKEEEYIETSKFAEEYLSFIRTTINRINSKEKSYKREVNENITESLEYIGNFVYLVIDNKTGVGYVNGNHDFSYITVNKWKEEILSNKLYWCYENGKINTSIDKISEQQMVDTSFYENSLKDCNLTIYTAILDDLPYYDSYVEQNLIYSVVKSQSKYALINIPIIVIILIAMVPTVLIGIGKTREEGIYLNWFDKILIEIVIGILAFVDFLAGGFLFDIGVNIDNIIGAIFILGGLIILYISAIIFLETFVKRIKTHTFLKTTLVYWMYKEIKKIIDNMKLSLKATLGFGGFILVNWLILLCFRNEEVICILLLLTLYISAYTYIIQRVTWTKKISGAINEIYNGNTNVRLEEDMFKDKFLEVAKQVNDIAGGFSNAIEEGVKSERLKTELITNVSHDIKTPLTSIINYVDLLKKDDLTEEKKIEYLEILDAKSQRLKKLTEDLVEASKASSGNIKLNMEKLNVNELIKQISGEFEDKFKARNLEEDISFAENDIYINADSRYMYRIIENMYSNVSKYAMPNSRVYTDIIDNGNNVIIQIKNISEQKLNITADELMQRFVRGDASRNTEGSGLGLSIAQSLTELQHGRFHIYLDGDLFKITIGFQKMKI